jgi:hypothetical protein
MASPKFCSCPSCAISKEVALAIQVRQLAEAERSDVASPSRR